MNPAVNSNMKHKHAKEEGNRIYVRLSQDMKLGKIQAHPLIMKNFPYTFNDIQNILIPVFASDKDLLMIGQCNIPGLQAACLIPILDTLVTSRKNFLSILFVVDGSVTNYESWRNHIFKLTEKTGIVIAEVQDQGRCANARADVIYGKSCGILNMLKRHPSFLDTVSTMVLVKVHQNNLYEFGAALEFVNMPPKLRMIGFFHLDALIEKESEEFIKIYIMPKNPLVVDINFTYGDDENINDQNDANNVQCQGGPSTSHLEGSPKASHSEGGPSTHRPEFRRNINGGPSTSRFEGGPSVSRPEFERNTTNDLCYRGGPSASRPQRISKELKEYDESGWNA